MEPRIQPARCLIVDAEHDVRALIADVLRALGHHDEAYRLVPAPVPEVGDK